LELDFVSFDLTFTKLKESSPHKPHAHYTVQGRPSPQGMKAQLIEQNQDQRFLKGNNKTKIIGEKIKI
jgi:hypothetical protein